MLKSRIAIDYRNVMAPIVGEADGLRDAELNSTSSALRSVHRRIWNEHADGGQRWLDLPVNTDLAAEIAAFADESRDRCDDFILVGIGGSSLGAIATIMATTDPNRNLKPARERNGPRFFVLDNPDPESVASVLATVNLEKTLVNVVTKSGQTAETMANFLVIRDALIREVGEERARQQIVATTDPEDGLLRQMADAEGYRTFPVPTGVDGRMTVLSAVGMLPAAICGVDIDLLLEGGRAMRDRLRETEALDNPGSLLAAINWLAVTRHDKSMLVTMPYSGALFGISDWFRQLWAESLGKRLSANGEIVHAGQTPIRALGAIDQHSQIQLYTEGPNDKVISLIGVDAYRNQVTVDRIPEDIPDLTYLQDAELGELLDRERRATAWALTSAHRPNYSIQTPVVDASVVGELFVMYEWQTVVAGDLFQVNPFGQPGVEAGKNATYALMNREGFEDLRETLTTARPGDQWVLAQP